MVQGSRDTAGRHWELHAKVDIWSLGCIAGEMLVGSALFPGDSEIATLFKIFKAIGTPTEKTWPGIKRLNYMSSQYPRWSQTQCEQFFRHRQDIGKEGLDLLNKMLTPCPDLRVTAFDVKYHPFFNLSSGP